MLLPAIRSRRFPYGSIATFVTALAQLDQIRLRYQAIEQLDLNPPTVDNGLIFPGYERFKLTPPLGPETLDTAEDLNPSLRTKIQVHLATILSTPLAQIKEAFPLSDPVLQFGRIVLNDQDVICCHSIAKMTEDSRDNSFVRDVICCHSIAKMTEDSRDNSFVRYDCEIDRNASRPGHPSNFYTKTFFGQIEKVIVFDLPAHPDIPAAQEPKIAAVALINQTPTTSQHGHYWYRRFSSREIVDLNTVKCVVGRIKHGDKWAYIDRNAVVHASLA
ncbi:hypothetical protein CVT24_001708 [Panaeolus cyanescens]|uniref:Uncharacterized protein n=1 Tax=Panaeolus cyanescens TaxID=181874 RepID=A0A409YUF0_9AGAR|nr:hypothetical protein CVT24_001708 [Panaeolus cyanescens]